MLRKTTKDELMNIPPLHLPLIYIFHFKGGIRMKKMLVLALSVFVLSTSATVSAHEYRHNGNSKSHHESSWHSDRPEQEREMPFKWHEKHGRLTPNDHRTERIHDREFRNRFPGLRAYRWHDVHDRGFRYHGHLIKDAVLFYNDSDELVSVGYMRDGAFIVIRDDHSTHEHHDSFFASWWRH